MLSKTPERKAGAKDVALAKTTEKEYLVTSEEIEVEEKNILLMYFYKQSNLVQGSTQAELRVFLSEDDYITQMLGDTRKWRTGSLANIIGGWNWSSWYERCAHRCIIGKDSPTDASGYFLGKTDNIMQEVDDLQKEIMAKRLDNEHSKVKNRIDRQMSKIKELPKDFDKWIDETGLFHSRYIYYKYKARKVLDGYCTHCKSDVEIEGPKHNEVGVCPNCKSHILYKSMGNSRNVTDKGQVAIIQKFGTGVIVRYFTVSKSYGIDFKTPKSYHRELTRDIYDEKGQMESYEWLSFKQTGKMRWCDSNDTFGFHNAVLYEKNLDKVLKDTMWQYSAIKQFATHEQGFGFPVYQYLKKYKEFPALEYLVKLELYNLTRDTVYSWYRREAVNLSGKTLVDVLGIGKEQLTVAKRINATTPQLEIIKETSKADIKITDEQIIYIDKHFRIEQVLEVAKYTTVHQIIKYTEKQSTKKKTIADTFRDWLDYIRNCEELKYDLTNDFTLFPRNLTEEHDRAYKLVQKKQKDMFDKAIKSMSDELTERYKWEYGDYIIKAPGTADEITKEGQTLRHCVGSYLERVAKREKIILFLRKKEKPEEPFYTIEINPKQCEVQQCRGKKNKSKTKEVEKVINRFKKEKLEPLRYEKAV